MIVEYTRTFDRNYSRMSPHLQSEAKEAIDRFLDSYASHQFPKGLRVHKCGPFISLSISMNTRIYVSAIRGGVRFAFIGDHQDADNYLKRS